MNSVTKQLFILSSDLLLEDGVFRQWLGLGPPSLLRDGPVESFASPHVVATLAGLQATGVS
jgi:hypothetical protein